MRSKLHHFMGHLWYSEELDKVGSMGITATGDVQIEYVDDDGYSRPRRWRPREVELIAADDPRNRYAKEEGEVLR